MKEDTVLGEAVSFSSSWEMIGSGCWKRRELEK
jgi:hypothetical protein